MSRWRVVCEDGETWHDGIESLNEALMEARDARDGCDCGGWHKVQNEDTGETHKRHRKRGTYACSECRQSGHNRRSCPLLTGASA